jgi:hypothetical protein
MAFMLPAQVESFKTEGEGRFYRFLATVAKPDSSYLAWYTPDLQGKEPDFILLGLEHLTPKGWTEDQIAMLVYVGITRARYKLVIPCGNRTTLIEKLERVLVAPA